MLHCHFLSLSVTAVCLWAVVAVVMAVPGNGMRRRRRGVPGGGGLSGFGGLERTRGGPRCRGGVLPRQGDRRDERRGEGDAGGEQESEPQAAGLGGHRG